MSKRLTTNRKSRYWLLSLTAIVLFSLMVPAAAFADGTEPDPPVQDPPPANTNDTVAPEDDPIIDDGVAPESDSLTKLEILLLTLLATF